MAATDDHPNGETPLQPHVAELVDGLSDRFEELWRDGWRRGTPPSLSDADRFLEIVRSQLHRELAAIDVEFRARAGQKPSVDDYRHWLDDASRLWLQSHIDRFIGPTSAADFVTPVDGRVEENGSAESRTSTGELTQALAATRTPVADFDVANARTTSAIDPLIGVTLGDYQLVERLGEGGMGVVYRGARVDFEQRVAIKLMRSSLGGPTARARFERERETLARLDHPNIARLYGGGIAPDGSPYFVMEFVDGERLDRHVEASGRSVRESVALVLDICNAVAAAHRAGVIHRDLKPANVIVTADGRAKVLDFGLARSINSDEDFTVTGDVVGTPAYMAPEQAGGAGALVGPATDVYGLGATLYRLLAGRPPFVGNISDVLGQLKSTDPISPRALNPGVDRDLDTICMKCLNKEPNRRYMSVEALATDLRAFPTDDRLLLDLRRKLNASGNGVGGDR